MSSTSALNTDILLHIVAIVAKEHSKLGKKIIHGYRTGSYHSDTWAKHLLLALRCTCRFLAISIAPLFFSHIAIAKIDTKSAKYLQCISNSPSIRPVVKKYTLKPAVVHTAPVVKSNPHQYYADLILGDAYRHHEPRYSALEAEHEMRKRVKAHWDEQQHFLVPDHGTLSYLARVCTEWLLRSPSLGSALQHSIFLATLHHFENLHELVICYDGPRDRDIIRTVDEDLSIGLASYLAQTGRRQLQVLRLEQVHSSDLEILVSTLQAATSSPQSSSALSVERQNSMPASWPSPSAISTPSTAPFSLSIRTLDIMFAEDLDHDKPSPTAKPLSTLLSYSENLTSLSLRSPVGYGSYTITPSQADFQAPYLPHLVDLVLESIITDVDAILSLTVPNKTSLKQVVLTDVALQKGTWADIWRVFSENMKQTSVRRPRVGYMVRGEEWEDMDSEDWKALKSGK
ncbi:MAG: hypothetical protein Q9186_006988 [Xanthomendoza sp. 1 TL-2023]